MWHGNYTCKYQKSMKIADMSLTTEKFKKKKKIWKVRAEIKEIKHHKENAKFQIQIKNTFGIVFVKLI